MQTFVNPWAPGKMGTIKGNRAPGQMGIWGT